jgi:hypothetical protein
VVRPRGGGELWRVIRGLPDFRRLLTVRVAGQFADGLFWAGLAGGLLFNPERASSPWGIAAAFAVLFLPYSVLGPFAGALLDRWDRRTVLITANTARLVGVAFVAALLATGAGDLAVLCAARAVNGLSRFILSGLGAALPHVVPRDRVVTMNSVAVAVGAAATFLGANSMLLPRWLLGAGDAGAASVIGLVSVPIAVAVYYAAGFAPHSLGPGRSAPQGSALVAVARGWSDGARAVASTPSVAAGLAALAAHRMTFGINSLLVLMLVRNTDVAGFAGLGIAALFVAATGTGSFAATVLAPAAIARWGRRAVTGAALLAAAGVQLAAATLDLSVMVLCALLLGFAGQLVKLAADSAMQIDVPGVLRGHVFAVQDALFWLSFIAAVTAAAAVIPPDGRSPLLAVAGSLIYLTGLGLQARVGRPAN